MRLNPYHPQRYWSHLGRAKYTARLYADAIQSFSKLTPVITRTMPSLPHPWLSWETARPAQPMLGR